VLDVLQDIQILEAHRRDRYLQERVLAIETIGRAFAVRRFGKHGRLGLRAGRSFTCSLSSAIRTAA
jgi:hypothetical protein